MRLRTRFLHFLGLRNPEHPILVRAQRLRRRLLHVDTRLRADYLRMAIEPKLQIGGGWHRLADWLNTDISLIPDVMRLDARRPFPFRDGTFHAVYTEHMIEHLRYEECAYMLRECHRVMRTGAVIRVTTPNLEAILGLRRADLPSEPTAYLAWFGSTFVPEDDVTPAIAINAMFRMWGHQFIYDEQELTRQLRAAGFTSVKRHALGESDNAAMCGLENTSRYPTGLLNYESIALEAIKA